MWIMTNYGILMPASIPAGVDLLLEDPDWDLQIRSRDRKTLQKCRAYMRNFHTSEIFATPEMDYDFRFYCAAADFGDAVRWMIIEIDYEKFKPTTERKGGGGKRLHDLYNRIWGVVYVHYERNSKRRKK